MILYQILMGLALPFFLAHAFWQGGAQALRERLGICLPTAMGQTLWLHGASVGELTSARWVIHELIAKRPGLSIFVTANSVTGRDMVGDWNMPGVRAALAPLDGFGAAGRLLDRLRPQALIIVENELWPARIAAAHRRGVQVLVIGARLSERSFARWGRFPLLIGGVLAQIDWLSPQDDASGVRLLALGLAAEALGPTVTLKALVVASTGVAPFLSPAPRTATLLAASTHDSEEPGIVRAFARARAQGGPRVLILAPRHPQRGGAIATMIAAQGLSLAQWSKAEVPGPQTQVFLADTLGEMPSWYAMAGICLIGGSFANRGGHTPFEPASYDCALIHGPSVHNFAPQFSALDHGGGALALGDLDELPDILKKLDVTAQLALCGAARPLLAQFSAGAQDIILRLLMALPSA